MVVEKIDLRSDTLTLPNAEMRRAMAEAEVGDDVFGEDPTVRRLEEEAAAVVGKAAAVFVPSGTMGNQICLHLHTRPGDEILCEAMSHVFHYEMGALAVVSGVQAKPLPSDDGLLEADVVRAAIVRDVPYQSRTAALVVENTHNFAGGTVYDRERLGALAEAAREGGLRLHVDGARIFNAAVALGCSVAALAEGCDSLTFCLSKGLGAPVGSLICGSEDFILEARRIRKMLGGGMRQVGVLAAAGLVALRKGPLALAGDHSNASLLADGLSELSGVTIAGPELRTNIVVCRLREMSASVLAAKLEAEGVLSIPLAEDRLRFVTHRDLVRDQVERALEIARRVILAPP